MSRMLFLGLLAVVMVFGKSYASEVEPRQRMDVVVAIDTTGSMQHVIEAAKRKVWSIVNELAKAKPTPLVRLGLIAYRGEGDEGTGYVLQTHDLTEDLDKIYQHLTALATNGGDRECVGRVLFEATHSLSWDDDPKTYRVIWLVGNERASQDSDQARFGYQKTAKEAIQKDIVVNTIYCGEVDFAAAEPEWKEIARMADGTFAAIELSGRTIALATPFDQPLAEANTKLNDTYVSYGTLGKEAKDNQARQDDNAALLGASVVAERAQCKSSGLYRNSSWDLVDALRARRVKLEDLRDEELPEELQKLSPEERKAFVATMDTEREEVRKQIEDLSRQREQFIVEEMKKQGLDDSKNIDGLIRKTLCEQASRKGFQFENQ